jgi:hypothetical protein
LQTIRLWNFDEGSHRSTLTTSGTRVIIRPAGHTPVTDRQGGRRCHFAQTAAIAEPWATNFKTYNPR